MARPIYAPATPPGPSPLELPNLERRDARLDLTLIILVMLLVPIGFEVAAGSLFSEDDWKYENLNPATIYTMLIGRKWFDALLAVGVAGYLLHRHRMSATSFGMQVDRVGIQILWSVPTLVAVYVVFFVTVIVVTALMFAIPGVERDLAERADFLEMLPLRNMLATLLLLIPVAIHEELLFRGLLLPYLRRIGCTWPVAIAISSCVFALLHLTQGWMGATQVFFIGVVLGVFFLLSRSLLAVMIAHFTFDLIQMQIARFLLPWIQEAGEKVPVDVPV
jgi:membrane protease YdiL (CAAX protease family)